MMQPPTDMASCDQRNYDAKLCMMPSQVRNVMQAQRKVILGRNVGTRGGDQSQYRSGLSSVQHARAHFDTEPALKSERGSIAQAMPGSEVRTSPS